MKSINFMIIMSSVVLAACVPSSESNKLKTSATSKSTTPGTGTTTPEPVVPTTPTGTAGVSLKTFNQYNQTLSKITEVDSATPAIAAEYELIKNSLPSEHAAGAFTSFHQISQTRLAFSYCNNFIDNNAEFKAINFATIAPQDVTSKILTKFIGPRPTTKYELYDQYHAILLKIMNNDAGLDDNDTPIGDLVPTATGATAMKNLTKLACTAILSSTEFTTL